MRQNQDARKDMHRSLDQEERVALNQAKTLFSYNVTWGTMSDLNNDGGFEMKIKYCTKIIEAGHLHYLQ